MKTCPVCRAVSFDDAPVCYGCLHRFDAEEGGDGGRKLDVQHGESAACADPASEKPAGKVVETPLRTAPAAALQANTQSEGFATPDSFTAVRQGLPNGWVMTIEFRRSGSPGTGCPSEERPCSAFAASAASAASADLPLSGLKLSFDSESAKSSLRLSSERKTYRHRKAMRVSARARKAARGAVAATRSTVQQPAEAAG